ncbi:MAG: PDZ domain-containing protein [Acidobacteria bacterium]|nr:PDZ domain-containing protein [Acidobacteriota bacterium]
MKTIRTVSLLLASIAITAAAHAQDGELARLLRFPDIHEEMVTFVNGGDIWLAASSGGVATRLTSHAGLELFPKFSPDGRWIAFSAQYDGTRQIYVMPTAGGTPRQLTFYNDIGNLPPRGGFDYQVLDWAPDGKSILFLAHRLPWGERMRRHYTIDFDGGMEAPLEIPQGSGGMYSPDGTQVVYTPIEREYRTWKRYRGGRAQDVWVWDIPSSTVRQVTSSPATDNQPVWVRNRIYFTSDRDGHLNLWSSEADGGETQVTHHDTWDALWPSAGPDQIVYENGGYLRKYDVRSGTDEIIPIRLRGDFEATLPRVVDVGDRIQSVSPSPTGVRAVVEARGEIFTVPAEKGEPRILTRTPGVREHSPSWSPDGSTIIYLSDRSGEYEIWTRPADGSGEEKQLTRDGDTWRYAPMWSPDGRRIAYSDRRARLKVLDTATGRTIEIDMGRFSDITDYQWSGDSRWLTWTNESENTLSSVWVYSIAAGTKHRLTSEDTDEANPVFDPEGRYLYFLSNRDFNLTFSDYEFTYLFTDARRVYVGVLAKDGPALLLPESDEEPVTGDEQDDSEESDEEPDPPAGAPKPVRIDPDGFENRVRAIPGSPSNYRALSATTKGPVYIQGGALKRYDIDVRKEETILEGIQAYEISRDGQKVLYRAGPNYGIVAMAPGQKSADGRLELDELETMTDPRLEWRQEYRDAWRTFRDWFYDENMHGVDWEAMYDKYEPLVSHIAHRSDLDYILGELGGELNAGHVYVQSAPSDAIDRTDHGLLGAEIVADPSGYFRIEKIFPGENWQADFRSPLTEPGVDVNEGDYIIAVDGVSTRTVKNFYELMRHTADRVVALEVSSRPSPAGARTEQVRPIAHETNLRYLDWVQGRRRYVDEQSNGRIGYIHLPNTAVEGTRELFKYFYPQARKDALVLDARYNGGGFIPAQMIELLERPVLSYWVRRDIEPFMTPGFAHTGPKAVLVNGYSSSGGDAFPYYFRKRGLGPVIGTRTWGGLIGISGNPQLMDGGGVLVPTFRFLDPEGYWAVENTGVAPDIEVVDRPDLEAQGIDPSLDTALEYLLNELEENPPTELVIPAPPAEPDMYPDGSRR